MLFRHGVVHGWYPISLTLACNVNLRNYPFDIHHCTLPTVVKMNQYSLTSADIEYVYQLTVGGFQDVSYTARSLRRGVWNLDLPYNVAPPRYTTDFSTYVEDKSLVGNTKGLPILSAGCGEFSLTRRVTP